MGQPSACSKRLHHTTIPFSRTKICRLFAQSACSESRDRTNTFRPGFSTQPLIMKILSYFRKLQDALKTGTALAQPAQSTPIDETMLATSSPSSINLLSYTGKVKVLHLTWFAFFLTFVVWFNHAPLMAAIRDTLGLSDEQVSALLMINVALTIPARIIIGMLVDHFGPRLVYTWLLLVSSLICLLFALATSFQQLLLFRFLLGFVGAGFVIGIRMIGEWFPSRQVGLAEGIYGGWGNFGSEAAALVLPSLALLYDGDNGWRYAIGTTAVMIFLYAFVYYRSVRDTPEGATYFKPNKRGALEVTSVGDFWFCLLMHVPLFAALAILTSRLTALGVLPGGAAI